MSYENVKSYFKSARMEQRIMESEQSRTMKQYIVDAFTNQVFSGNPAAIRLFLRRKIMARRELAACSVSLSP